MAGPRTGCGCMTSKTGCLIIGWLDVIFLIVIIIGGLTILTVGSVRLPSIRWCDDTHTILKDFESLVDSARNNRKDDKCLPLELRQQFTVGGIVLLATGVLFLFVPCCLIHGVSNKKAAYLMPCITCSILATIVLFLFLIGALGSPSLGFIFNVILLAWGIYRTVVVCCHYKYLTRKPNGDVEMMVNKSLTPPKH